MPVEATKTCSNCGRTKPVSGFYKMKTGRYGVMGICKQCVSEQKKQRYDSDEEFRERRKQQAKEYYQNNKERVKTYFKQWIKNNPDYTKQYMRKWRDENREYYRKYIREYQRTWKKKK